MTDLTITEVGERWPMAAVLWDRDVMSVSAWEPVFRVLGDSVMALEVSCAAAVSHRPRCLCRRWDLDRERWRTMSEVKLSMLNADLHAGRVFVRDPEWHREWSREYMGSWAPRRPRPR